MKHLRLGWLAGFAAVALLITLAALINPVQIEITIAPRASAAYAGLPTVTPLPPTPAAPPLTPTEAPPTATVPVPTEPPTPVAPPATSVPPERERRQPTVTPMAPSVTPMLPPVEEERHPQLVIIKRSTTGVVHPGDRVSFEIELTNRGDAPALDVVVTDEVPLPLKVVDLRSTMGDIVVEGQRVIAFPRRLGPGEVIQFTIVAAVPLDTPVGRIANTAVVTSSSPDDPGDNTSTAAIEIAPLLVKQSAPPRLPTTADPTEAAILARYWPLLVLALSAMLFGALLRTGAFRQRTLLVRLAHAVAATEPSPPDTNRPTHLMIDPDEIQACWAAGASTRELVMQVASRNPSVDRLTISLAIQQMLRDVVAGSRT
jgi:uncharacterized repeat protein (TIGR01451 family)